MNEKFSPPPSVAELFFQAWSSGRLTENGRYGLRDAFLNGQLHPDDLTAVNRLVHAVRRGWLAME
ncbi:hypothetical protein AY599_16000 [Leptolyngbya valderiana BDU 20041]|nr:hypothetical protein [Geitlerinema sp. CS-897]OAB63440.1 hypothetical protein AY599_16000 [Leptolyngbya valderiana BDU 20041]PPT06557.1 hypothetical protein CKA32_004260 [Geitlerinema sp. FC II]